jgi:hypothetical protein
MHAYHKLFKSFINHTTNHTAHELYAECRQVVVAEGVKVYTAPCASAPEISPPRTFAKCERVEHIVGNVLDSTCGDGCWAQIRYHNSGEATGIIGWVLLSTQHCADVGGSGSLQECPATSACPQGAHACAAVVCPQPQVLQSHQNTLHFASINRQVVPSGHITGWDHPAHSTVLERRSRC